jgi:Flp pilus assembly protein CpaB
MVLLGIAFFVVGLAAVYLVTKDDNGGGGSGDSQVTTVVATRVINSGSLGDELIQQGALKEIKVPGGQRLADAVGSVESLRNTRFTQGFAKDQQISQGGVQSLGSSIEIPKGFEAVAVQVDFVAGGAGYVHVGDRVNLYGVYKDTASKTNGALHVTQVAGHAELVLTNVTVLDVSLDIPPRRSQAAADDTGTAPSRVGSQPITYLLSLKTVDVEKVVFLTSFEEIYATLVPKKAAAAGPTEGNDLLNIHAVEPNAPR